MCRRYPGPRCSKATISFMLHAKEKLEKAKENNADPEVIDRLQASLNAHIIKVQNTPQYQREVEKKGQADLDSLNSYKNKITRAGVKARGENRLATAKLLERTRLQSRKAARSETLAKWTEDKEVKNPDGSVTIKKVHREMSVAQAAAIVNAQTIEEANLRSTTGNIARASTIRNKPLNEHQLAAVEKFKAQGFPMRQRSVEDFSYSYHRNMEPRFKPASKGRVPATIGSGKSKKKVKLVKGTQPMTSTIRVHDDNGLTHEAKVTVATVQAEDKTYHTITRIVGSSSLFGNRAAQDSMDASNRGSLLRTDAPKWSRTIVSDSGRVKRDQVRKASRLLEAYTRPLETEDGKPTGTVSGALAGIVSLCGTESINYRVRRNMPLSHTTLDADFNFAQTSSTDRPVAKDKPAEAKKAPAEAKEVPVVKEAPVSAKKEPATAKKAPAPVKDEPFVPIPVSQAPKLF